MHNRCFVMPNNGIQIARQIVSSCNQSKANVLFNEIREERAIIQWQPPPADWCKLNSDEWSDRKGNVGCGGVIRGDCGE